MPGIEEPQSLHSWRGTTKLFITVCIYLPFLSFKYKIYDFQGGVAFTP